MEIAALTAFLAPFLPHLLKPIQDAAADAAERFGEAAWEQAKILWGRLRGKVEAKPSASEAAADVAKAPDDSRARTSLEWQLQKLVDDDPAFAEELAELWERAKRAADVTVTVTASGERAVAIGGNNTGDIRTGDSTGP
jgi:hypothetical protein